MLLATIVQNLKETNTSWARAAIATMPRDEKREAMRRKFGLPELVKKPARAGITTYSAVPGAK